MSRGAVRWILVTGADRAVGGVGRTLTGEAPTSVRDFVKRHAAEFARRGAGNGTSLKSPARSQST